MSAPGNRADATNTPAGAPAPLRTACRASALALLICMIASAFLLPKLSGYTLARYLFKEQDVIWITVAIIGLLGLGTIPWSWPKANAIGRLARRPDGTAFGLAVFVVLIGAVGVFLVFRGFHLTRDEVMADFDALILSSGRALATIPAEWQELKDALSPEFLLPIPGPVWASSYLPGNAALRTVVGSVTDPGWTSPILAGVAMLALYRIARRLWPGRPDATVVSLLLLAASSQVLVMAMTSYAMTAHLALDLVWLALFLRDDRRGHAGAVAIGALASGLHQIVFHPLFAAPFILQLWLRRRRALALGYVAAYALIGAFWVSYWSLVLPANGGQDGAAAGLGAAWLVARVVELLGRFGIDGIILMFANLVRFVAWQHLLLVPLAVAAFGAVRRDEGIARPLAGGIVLTLLAVFVLLPYQGHGWGFRYLHGVLGNVCLLGGYGWIAVTTASASREREQAWSAFGAATAFALFVMLPVHVAHAVRIIAPNRAAVAAIERTAADIVIVDSTGIAFGSDLVRNDPFLRNRPKVLDLDFIREPQLADLCAHNTVAVFGAEQAEPLGVLMQPAPKPREDALRARRRAVMAQLGCGTAAELRPNRSAP